MADPRRGEAPRCDYCGTPLVVPGGVYFEVFDNLACSPECMSNLIQLGKPEPKGYVTMDEHFDKRSYVWTRRRRPWKF
jgi:hypothetical protein